MTQIFIFTAGNPAARSHLSDSITGAIDLAAISRDATSAEAELVAQVHAEVGALYAWGAEPGPRNGQTWDSMHPGDLVLGVYGNSYRHVSRVVRTIRSRTLAEAIWGTNEATGQTSELMYFLTEPQHISVPVHDLEEDLYRGYQGFTSISEDRLASIRDRYGSVDAFVQQELLGTAEAGSQPRDDLRPVLAKYLDAGVVFESSARGRRYRVEGVDQAGANIERADGGDTSRITVSAYHELVSLVESKRGSLALSDISGDRVRGATFAQGRRFAVSPDRSHLVDVSADERAIEHFTDAFRQLRVDRSGGKPRLYKPLMLASVLDAVADGTLKENRIEFDWLLPRFVARADLRGIEATEQQAAYAFANLAGELFWLLAYQPEAALLASSSPSPKQVRDSVSFVMLKERLWDLLQQPESLQGLRATLNDTWNLHGETKMPPSGPAGLRDAIEKVMEGYVEARAEQFNSEHPIYRLVQHVGELIQESSVLKSRPHLRVKASGGQGNWARVPWISVIAREGSSIQSGVYCVYLFRQDMRGVYLTFNQGVTRLKKQHGVPEARRILRSQAKRLRAWCTGLERSGFLLDHSIDLATTHGLGKDYEASTVAHKRYDSGQVLGDEELYQDLEDVVSSYDQYLNSDDGVEVGDGDEPEGDGPEAHFDLAVATEKVLRFIESRGFVYEPWLVAQYLTAIRTKPFVILAGITGTGKSKLPALVSAATRGRSEMVAVRPDWTDSADVLGYVDLQGDFRPGRVIQTLQSANNEDDRHWTCIVDEMNLARVEQYFAEVLSRMEDRRPAEGGGFESAPLLSLELKEEDAEWAQVRIPANLGLVGTVNMDESAHTFSRKVLDRAFTLELSDVELNQWHTAANPTGPATWPVNTWLPRAITLGGLSDTTDEEQQAIQSVITILTEANSFLKHAQLQVGYRTRDEAALFVLHARDLAAQFRTRSGEPVDPMDLVIQMKVLPRIAGGSSGVRRALRELLGWAYSGMAYGSEADARGALDAWGAAGRPGALADARLPRTSARLCLMWDRLLSEGFTSYWL